MQRTLSRDLKEKIGKTVKVQGWIHKKRLLGGLTFINVRDRSGLVQQPSRMTGLRAVQNSMIQRLPSTYQLSTNHQSKSTNQLVINQNISKRYSTTASLA